MERNVIINKLNEIYRELEELEDESFFKVPKKIREITDSVDELVTDLEDELKEEKEK